MALTEAVWDIRRELYEGEEPLFMVVAYVAGLPVGGSLRVRSLYPLAALRPFLGPRGVEIESEPSLEGYWVETFTRRADEPAAPPAASVAPPAHAMRPAVVDLRAMEPHEPLQFLLEHLAALEPGGGVTVMMERHPRYLFGLLGLLGLQCRVWLSQGSLDSVVFEVSRPVR